MPIKVHPSLAVHPGPWLRRNVVPEGMTVTDLAQRLGVTRPAMSNLLNGHAALSAEMALRFEKGFALSADTLLKMQAAHDLAKARKLADRLRVDPIAA